MVDRLGLDSLRRSLQDWRDYWLSEAAFMLPREARLLLQDLSQIPSSWNPVKLVGGDAERDAAITATVNHWIGIIQQRLVVRAVQELGQVLLRESASRPLVVKPDIPQLSAHGVANDLHKAALSPKWEQAVPGIVWAPASGSSAILDAFWAPMLERSGHSILEKVRAHPV